MSNGLPNKSGSISLAVAAITALLIAGSTATAARPDAGSEALVEKEGPAIDWREVSPIDSATASVVEDLDVPSSARPELPRPAEPEETPEPAAAPTTFWNQDRLTGDWGGLRTKLADRGITITPDLTVDFGANFRGGANTEGSAFRHLLNVGFTLDTAKAFDLRGGTIFANFQQQHGESGSTDAGSFQSISNADADGRTQLSEVWYQQVFGEDVLRLKVGKIDANTEFAVSKYAAEFINSSFGVSPTILGIPTYPDPSTGFAVFLKPCSVAAVSFGLFDGAGQEGIATGSRGPATLFGPPSDLFMIGELSLTWQLDGSRLGRIAGGAWHHTGAFDRFGGDADSGATGGYVIVDQSVWRENPQKDEDNQGMGVFLVYGYANPAISDVSHHVEAGVAWTGALPTRDSDVLGLAATWVRFSDAQPAGFSDASETIVELFYKLQITPWCSIKPDIQYIHNPGGLATQGDAVAANLRLNLNF